MNQPFFRVIPAILSGVWLGAVWAGPAEQELREHYRTYEAFVCELNDRGPFRIRAPLSLGESPQGPYARWFQDELSLRSVSTTTLVQAQSLSKVYELRFDPKRLRLEIVNHRGDVTIWACMHNRDQAVQAQGSKALPASMNHRPLG